MKYCKVREEHIFKNLRDLCVGFQHFQPLFVRGRVEAAAAVPALLSMGAAVKTFDLQNEYEQGRLVFA
jgi:hypothetical protein